MVRAPSTVFHHGWPRVRDWPIWTESRPLVTLLLAVACGYLGWIAFYAVRFHFHPDNLALFAAHVVPVPNAAALSKAGVRNTRDSGTLFNSPGPT